MSVETCSDAVLVFPALRECVNLIHVVETCADAVLVFSCPQDVCELDPCLWKLVLMRSLCFSCLSVGV